MQTSIHFKLERETKNTVRYAADNEAAAISTIYVSKHALAGSRPATLIVTVSLPPAPSGA
jgi:hypothetical protein